MKLKITLYSVCLLMLLAACQQDGPTPEPSVGSRTVLVYMIAQNSLAPLASADIEEMKEGMRQVDATSGNLLVYIDDYSAPRLIRLGKDKKGKVVEETIENYPEQNSADANVMKKVISTAFNQYKAEKYGMVFWSHGEGWIPSPAKTRWFGQDGNNYMDIADLHAALQVAPDLDFLFFDACFMEAVEVAYALRDCGSYLISSPTEIPGPGAPYQTVVPAMFSAENAALKIASCYYDYYQSRYNDGIGMSNEDWTGGVSVGVAKMSELENLAVATSKVLPRYITGKQNFDLSGVMCYDRRTDKQYYYDLDRFIYQITAGNGDYDSWREAFDKVMVYWKSTPLNYSAYAGMFTMNQDAKGLSTYIPRMSAPSLNTSYQQTEWYKVSGWADTGWYKNKKKQRGVSSVVNDDTPLCLSDKLSFSVHLYFHFQFSFFQFNQIIFSFVGCFNKVCVIDLISRIFL